MFVLVFVLVVFVLVMFVLVLVLVMLVIGAQFPQLSFEHGDHIVDPLPMLVIAGFRPLVTEIGDSLANLGDLTFPLRAC